MTLLEQGQVRGTRVLTPWGKRAGGPHSSVSPSRR